MSEWQPIETAPKDGTRVMLFAPYYGGCVVAGYEVGAWYAMNGIDVEEPTHWQHLPLPPPPEVK